MINKIPEEIIIKIILHLDLGDFNNMFLVNKMIANTIVNNSAYIIKNFFKKYNVQWSNQSSLLNILIRNNNKYPYYQYGREHKCQKTFMLLFQFQKFRELFKAKAILDLPDELIGNFPILPNLIELKYDKRNYISDLPKLDSLTRLTCNYNIYSNINYSNFRSLQYLNCSGCLINELPPMIELKILKCSGNNITKIPFLPKLEYLECNNCLFQDITWLNPDYVPKLKNLQCYDNFITSIPVINTLEILNCSDCQILTFLPCMNNLKSLVCNRCSIVELPCIQSLQYICADSCIIRQIPFYKNLKELYCHNNSLIEEIPLMETLQKLNCNNCSLREIKEYPLLTSLSCSRNFITKIPKLENLIYLDCSWNRINTLPQLDKLENLFCNNNERIKEIKGLNNLEALICNNCNITYLDPYMYKLEKLLCSRNQIQVIPKYPNLNYLKCDGNPIIKIHPMINLKIIFYPEYYELDTSLFPNLMSTFNYNIDDN